MFNPLIWLSLLSSTLALPTLHQQERRLLAPLRRAESIPRAIPSSPNAYIVSLRPGTVDPSARADWLSSVLDTPATTSNLTSTANNTVKTNESHHDQHSLRHGYKRTEDNGYVLGWDERVFNGLAGTFTDSEVDALRARDEVAYIQQDILLHTTSQVNQTNAPWGISRLSSIDALLANSNPADLNFQYVFDSSGGQGVDVYVLDTGVRTTHQDFGGRAIFLQSFGSGVPGQDINGHGSHVSGTAIGSVFGMAKSATIQMIKCMDDSGSGTTADIVSAINLAATTAGSTGRPSVVSMSIAGPANQAIDDAVSNSVSLGVPFVVAAGNESRDADEDSPARLGGPNGNSGVITVGATVIDDTLATFSNTGSNVDILAPGQDVLSVGVASDTAVQNLSGTSMSTPHISGLAALILGSEGNLSPAALKARILSLSSSGVISGVVNGTSNLLGSTINGL